jgi:hypothetical protein
LGLAIERSSLTIPTSAVMALEYNGLAYGHFSILVESSSADVVVERAMYRDGGGVFWESGTVLVGAPLLQQ